MAGGYDTAIRAVLRDHARLPVNVDTLGDDADLFAAGMSSHASVNVMLALEDTFDRLADAVDAHLDTGLLTALTRRS